MTKVRISKFGKQKLSSQLAAYPWRNEIGELGYEDEMLREIIWAKGSQYYLKSHVEVLK